MSALSRSHLEPFARAVEQALAEGRITAEEVQAFSDRVFLAALEHRVAQNPALRKEACFDLALRQHEA